MSRAIFTAIALVLSCGFASGEVSQSVPASAKPLFESYESCVVGRARSFSGSADSAESISKNAMTACATEKRAFDDALRLAGLGSDDVAGLLANLDQQVFQAASSAVLEERAAH